MKQIFNIILETGLFDEEITVEYRPLFSGPYPDCDFAGVHHLEFHGRMISNTSYLSHFVFVKELEDTTIETYIAGFVKHKTNTKIKSIGQGKTAAL